mgnify:CR=1 FL=1
MGCNDSTKIRCKKVSAECVSYERELPIFSQLEDCITIADTTEELYNLIDNIQDSINLENLESCVTLPENRDVNNLIQFLLDRDCYQQGLIEDLQASVETMQSQITALQEQNCP